MAVAAAYEPEWLMLIAITSERVAIHGASFGPGAGRGCRCPGGLRSQRGGAAPRPWSPPRSTACRAATRAAVAQARAAEAPT